MALAALCKEYESQNGTTLRTQGRAPAFVAFVVDHRLRDGSAEEAQQVARRLEGMGLPCKVLTLDWAGHVEKSSQANIEAAARRLRYQALGRACCQDRLSTLLFAHHADDQAETVLLRAANEFYGAGLAGMKVEAQIPECDGLYGVRQSGLSKLPRINSRVGGVKARIVRSLAVESGGVTVGRPLLSFTKQQLIATCQQAGVDWVDDATNKDPTFTLRNSIRCLQENYALPMALRRQRLCEVASIVQNFESLQDKQAQELFDRLHIDLDLRLGTVKCTLPTDLFDSGENPSDPQRLRARSLLLRKLLLLVSPTDVIHLKDLLNAVSMISAPGAAQDNEPRVTTVAGVSIVRQMKLPEKYELWLTRVPPTARATTAIHTEVFPKLSNYDPSSDRYWSDWQLWDHRYWIRVGSPRGEFSDAKFKIRFFTQQDLMKLRTGANKAKRSPFSKAMSLALGSARFTIPAIVPAGTKSVAADGQEFVSALPTLKWFSDGWTNFDAHSVPIDVESSILMWTCEVRYKHLDGS